MWSRVHPLFTRFVRLHFGVRNNLATPCMADAVDSSCSLICTRSLHERDGTYRGHLPRPTHHYGDVNFVYADPGTNAAPALSRTHLVRTSTLVSTVELGGGEAPRGPTDHYDFVPPGSADPDRPTHFKTSCAILAYICMFTSFKDNHFS